MDSLNEHVFSEYDNIPFSDKYAMLIWSFVLMVFLIGIGYYAPGLDQATSQGLDNLDTQNFATVSDVQEENERAWLGLEVVDVTAEVAIKAGLDKIKGALVYNVINGSPAAKAGILFNDIIVSFNGRGIRSAQELKNDLSGIEVGGEIEMCVVRDDYRMTVYAVAEAAPQWLPIEDKQNPWLGVEVSEIKAEEDKEQLEDIGKEGGVFVEKIIAGSPAAKAGIEPGDIFMSFNYRKIRSLKEFLTDLSGANIGYPVRICLNRGEIRKTLYPVVIERPQTAPIQSVNQSYVYEPSDDREWGVLLSPLTATLRERYSIATDLNGVIILDIEDGSPAQKAGLLRGDLITGLNQQSVEDMQTFFQAYADIEQGALLEIYRNQSFSYLSIGSSGLGMPSSL